MIQATYWQVQMTDGMKVRGGQSNLFIDDQNVSVVDFTKIKTFQIVHNSFRDMYYKPTQHWYHDTTPIAFAYPTEYIMGDGSVLTIVDKDQVGVLTVTQA